MQKLCIALAATGLLAFPKEALAADGRTLGFELGGTLEQAKRHAQSRGWDIRPYPGESHQRLWLIEGAEAVLQMCNNSVLGVTRHYVGGIDEFVALEAIVRREILNGPAVTNIQQLSSGNKRVSLIDAEFKAKDGSQTIVRLSSTDGEIEVLSITWLGEACNNKDQ